MYLSGLILKAETMEPGDEDNVGSLLVCLVLVAVICVIVAVVIATRELVKALFATRELAKIMCEIPQQDPPDNTEAFYAIQNPVEDMNLGDVFRPRHPPISIDPHVKLQVMRWAFPCRPTCC
jgi:hypothetical protein